MIGGGAEIDSTKEGQWREGPHGGIRLSGVKKKEIEAGLSQMQKRATGSSVMEAEGAGGSTGYPLLKERNFVDEKLHEK